LIVPLEFLHFSRKNEEEADYLGLQYMYKAGYDPSAFVSMFEKLEAQERAKPGSISKLFSTHPPTPDRIEMTKKNIEQILSDREQYVLNTAEFDHIKARLAARENQPSQAQDTNRPLLKRTDRTPTNTDEKPDDKQPADDDHPVLKRRPDSKPQ
jgi:predicted Zn-dependent protease